MNGDGEGRVFPTQADYLQFVRLHLPARLLLLPLLDSGEKRGERLLPERADHTSLDQTPGRRESLLLQKCEQVRLGIGTLLAGGVKVDLHAFIRA
jgi:hypothetical protein